MTNEEIRDEFMKLAKTGWVEATDILKLRDAVLDRLTPPAEWYLDDMRIAIYFETAAKREVEELTPPAQPHELVAKVRKLVDGCASLGILCNDDLRDLSALADLCERQQSVVDWTLCFMRPRGSSNRDLEELTHAHDQLGRALSAYLGKPLDEFHDNLVQRDIEAKARRAADLICASMVGDTSDFRRQQWAAIIARVFAGGEQQP